MLPQSGKQWCGGGGGGGGGSSEGTRKMEKDNFNPCDGNGQMLNGGGGSEKGWHRGS